MIYYLAFFLAVFALVAVGALGFAAWVIVRCYREMASLDRSIAETVGKNMPLFMQTASALSINVDDRVAKRVAFINAQVLAGKEGQPQTETPSGPIAEMPMWTSSPGGQDAEDREIAREEHRIRRPGADPARDPGIGSDVGMPPPVRTEAL